MLNHHDTLPRFTDPPSREGNDFGFRRGRLCTACSLHSDILWLCERSALKEYQGAFNYSACIIASKFLFNVIIFRT